MIAFFSSVITIYIITSTISQTCCSSRWSAESQKYCHQKRDITILGEVAGLEYNYDSTFFDLIENAGPCSANSIRVFHPTFKRLVTVDREKGKKWWRHVYKKEVTPINDTLHQIELILENNESFVGKRDTKQTLIVESISHSPSEMELVFNKLEKLQSEKRWDVIFICYQIYPGNCPKKRWIPIYRIILSLWEGIPFYRRQFVALIKNPDYNLMNLYKRMELNNFNQSCFSSSKKSLVVIHIVFGNDFGYEKQPYQHLFHQAVAVVNQFPGQAVKFAFYSSKQSMDHDFAKFYLKTHNLDKKFISYQPTDMIISLGDIRKFKKKVRQNNTPQAVTRNFFFVRIKRWYTSYFCDPVAIIKNPEIMKNVYLYLDEYSKDGIPSECRSFNFIRTERFLIDEQLFYNTINDVACNITQT